MAAKSGIYINIGSDFDPKAFKKAYAEMGKLAGVSTKTGKTVAKSAGQMHDSLSRIGDLVGAAAIYNFFKQSVAAAKEEAVGIARLQQAVTNTGASWSVYGSQLEEVAKTTARLTGTTDDELRMALGTLIQTTGSTTKGIALLGLTTDFARAKQTDLVSAAQMVAKVANGQYTALNRLGIKLDKTATATDYLNEMQKRFHGQGAAYAATDAGKLAIATEALDDFQEAIGGRVIPRLGELARTGTSVLDVFKQMPQSAQNAVIDFGVFAGAAAGLTLGLRALGIQAAGAQAGIAGLGFGIGYLVGEEIVKLPAVSDAIDQLGDAAAGAVAKNDWMVQSLMVLANPIIGGAAVLGAHMGAVAEKTGEAGAKAETAAEYMARLKTEMAGAAAAAPKLVTALDVLTNHRAMLQGQQDIIDKRAALNKLLTQSGAASDAARSAASSLRDAEKSLAEASASVIEKRKAYNRVLRENAYNADNARLAELRLQDAKAAHTAADEKLARLRAAYEGTQNSVWGVSAAAMERDAAAQAELRAAEEDAITTKQDIKAKTVDYTDATTKWGKSAPAVIQAQKDLTSAERSAAAAKKAVTAKQRDYTKAVRDNRTSLLDVKIAQDDVRIAEMNFSKATKAYKKSVDDRIAANKKLIASNHAAAASQASAFSGTSVTWANLVKGLTGAGGGFNSGGGPSPNPAGGGDKVTRALAYAKSILGKPYIWGASGPSGFDCSGLVTAIFKSAGFNFGRITTASMSGLLKSGKLDSGPGKYITVGWYRHGNKGHMGVKIGSQWFESPHTGAVVRTKGAKSSWENYAHIPGYFTGTYATRPHLAVVGEQPEYIINPRQPSAPALIAAASRDAGIGGTVINLSIPVTAYIANDYDVRRMARVLAPEIDKIFAQTRKATRAVAGVRV